jgi:hypothetical protein
MFKNTIILLVSLFGTGLYAASAGPGGAAGSSYRSPAGSPRAAVSAWEKREPSTGAVPTSGLIEVAPAAAASAAVDLRPAAGGPVGLSPRSGALPSVVSALPAPAKHAAVAIDAVPRVRVYVEPYMGPLGVALPGMFPELPPDQNNVAQGNRCARFCNENASSILCLTAGLILVGGVSLLAALCGSKCLPHPH